MPHLRRRRPDDLPELCRILAEQQPSSGYPFRWPLPIPLESFIAREADVAAWVNDDPLSGMSGHVAVGRVTDDDFSQIFTSTTGLAPGDMRAVTALFTSRDARGQGIGNALLDQAERFVLDAGLTPVLDVLPTHAPALALYERRGWRIVHRGRASWLPDDVEPICYLVLEPTRRPRPRRAGASG